MDQEINHRIRQIMEYEQTTPANFAVQVGISRSNLTHILSGRNQPGFTMLEKVMRAFPEIRSEWLVTGLGAMLKDADELATTRTALKEKEKENREDTHFADDLFSGITENQEETEQSQSEVMSKSKESLKKNPPSPTLSVPERPQPSPTQRTTSRQRPPKNENPDRKIRKIVFFYTDNSFEEFFPSR